MTEDLTYKEELLKALDDGEYSYKDICLELIDFLYEEQIVDFSHEKGYLND
jgi:hypothetical protein